MRLFPIMAINRKPVTAKRLIDIRIFDETVPVDWEIVLPHAEATSARNIELSRQRPKIKVARIACTPLSLYSRPLYITGDAPFASAMRLASETSLSRRERP